MSYHSYPSMSPKETNTLPKPEPEPNKKTLQCG